MPRPCGAEGHNAGITLSLAFRDMRDGRAGASGFA